MDATPPTGTEGGQERRHGPEPLQLPLPDVDEPIPYRLTARARRLVAPDSLPDLAVLPDDAVEVHDTRPAQARALRRAGQRLEDIARRLGVDDLLVGAWIGDVAVVPIRTSTPQPPPATLDPDIRAAASRDGASRLDDPAFARGLGLLTGVSEVSPHGVVVTVRDEGLGGAVLRWLGAAISLDPARVRVVLRVSPTASGDVVAHRWAGALGLARERISTASWAAAPTPDTVEALVRVADPTVAATVAGWRDALVGSLGPDVPPTTDGGF